jgi:hypothetical protein
MPDIGSPGVPGLEDPYDLGAQGAIRKHPGDGNQERLQTGGFFADEAGAARRFRVAMKDEPNA